MSCKHGNHEDACDICDEVSAAYESGLIAGLTTPPVLAAPANSAVLPELPEPRHRGPDGTGSYFDSFTADQMRAHGQACAAAERELCAQECDDLHYKWRWDNEIDSDSGPRSCAAAIRART